MNKTLNKRALVSFDGVCPINCKHCYTYQMDNILKERTANEIVESLISSEFDVIYLSQKKENFINQKAGVELCNKLYNRYKKDLFVITRIALNDNTLVELKKLSVQMANDGNTFYLAVSIPCLDFYGITETRGNIATPQERIDCLKRANKIGLYTILMARPLYPNRIIPIGDVLNLINLCKDYIECVVSSGVAVNKKILEQLRMSHEKFDYLKENEYLVGAIPCKLDYVDVRKEMKMISEYCDLLDLPYFDHSLKALNYIKSKIE